MSINEDDTVHPQEMDQKNNVLASLDEAKLSWFHIKAILISGCGFFHRCL